MLVLCRWGRWCMLIFLLSMCLILSWLLVWLVIGCNRLLILRLMVVIWVGGVSVWLDWGWWWWWGCLSVICCFLMCIRNLLCVIGLRIVSFRFVMIIIFDLGVFGVVVSCGFVCFFIVGRVVVCLIVWFFGVILFFDNEGI